MKNVISYTLLLLGLLTLRTQGSDLNVATEHVLGISTAHGLHFRNT